MIWETAELVVDPDRSDLFEQAVARCAPLFRRAPGCHAMALERSVDRPGTYLLRVAWATVDAHTVSFRGSDDFQAWRCEVSPFFLQPPVVDHTAPVAGYFDGTGAAEDQRHAAPQNL